MKMVIGMASLGLVLAGCVSEKLPETCVVVEEVESKVSQNADSVMEYRTLPYLVSNVIYCGLLDHDEVEFKSTAATPEERKLQEYYAKLFGVTWPAGSSIVMVRSGRKDQLRVRNTVENLDRFEDGLQALSCIPTLVDIQVRFVEVDQKTLDAVGAELVPNKAADHRYDAADFEDVPAEVLERKFVARHDLLLNVAPKALTRQGEEVVLKTVKEYIYPTDYAVQMGESVCDGVNKEPSVKSSGIATVEPQSLTMREVGTILDVTPTVTDDGGLIDLKINTQFVDEPEWTDYGMQLPSPSGGTYAMPMKQPFFPVRSIDSEISVIPGETVLVGTLVSAQKSDATQFIFVRARKVDVRGRPVKDEKKDK